LVLLDNDGRSPFANRAMATAFNGRARLIPLVQRISFGSRLAFGGQSPLPFGITGVVWTAVSGGVRPAALHKLHDRAEPNLQWDSRRYHHSSTQLLQHPGTWSLRPVSMLFASLCS
jgi:hypothetical protein